MHRIDTSGSAAGMFKRSPKPATQVGPEWLNDVQENLLGVLELFVVAPVKNAYDQLAGIFESFGVPGRKAITDLDALRRSGFFASSATATGRPADVAGNLLSNFDFADEEDGVQLFFEKAGDGVWKRTFDGSAWSAWAKVLTSATGGRAGASVDARGTNGLCTIHAVDNVGSVNRTASGQFAVLFTTPMPHAKYRVTISAGGQNMSGTFTGRSINGFTILIQQANANVGDSPQNPDFSFEVFA